MAYQFPPDVQELVDSQMASGAYANEDDLLKQALRSLSDYKQTIDDVLEGLDDERAGRVRPLDKVDAELRQNYGINR